MRILYLLIITLTLLACRRNQQQPPKIDYDASGRPDSLTIQDISADTTKTLIATFPVYFDSTNVLIQPSGLVHIQDIKKGRLSLDNLSSYMKESKTGKYKEEDFYISGINNDNLSGQITNLYFDDLQNNRQQLLTSKIVNISNIIYLRDIFKKTGKQYLLYSVYDKDSNRDGKLNSDDILSLYISNLDGSGFNKITKENQEYSGGKLILLAQRFYFTTIEDISKDGKFGKEDMYYYHYIDFSTDSYKVVEYNPLNN